MVLALILVFGRSKLTLAESSSKNLEDPVIHEKIIANKLNGVEDKSEMVKYTWNYLLESNEVDSIFRIKSGDSSYNEEIGDR